MKKMLFILVLVALLLMVAIPIASAGMDYDDPCAPGYAQSNGHAQCFVVPPPGLQGNDNGNAGNNWVLPQTP